MFFTIILEFLLYMFANNTTKMFRYMVDELTAREMLLRMC